MPLPVPPGGLSGAGQQASQLFYSRRKLFEKILAHVAKRKLENHVQATGDRMSMTPQQFGMRVGEQVKKAGESQMFKLLRQNIQTIVAHPEFAKFIDQLPLKSLKAISTTRRIYDLVQNTGSTN
jgi:hypothetical protein